MPRESESKISRTDCWSTQTEKLVPGWQLGDETYNELLSSDKSMTELPIDGCFSNNSEMSLQRDIQLRDSFNLSRDAGHRANSEQNLNLDMVNSVVNTFSDLHLDKDKEHDSSADKTTMIADVLQQVMILEKQVDKEKEWAQQKAIQASQKLSDISNELKILRIQREETRRILRGKQVQDVATKKQISEQENALMRARAEADRVVLALEAENAEIRAEMEASKLSASESLASCLELAKKKKKHLKNAAAWKKQQFKLLEDVGLEKQTILNSQQRLVQVKAAQNEAEVKWRQDQKAKEQALAQAEEERRLMEATKASWKIKLKALRQKQQVDFQCMKEDLQRFQQELTHLQASTQSNSERQHPTTNTKSSENTTFESDLIPGMLMEFDMPETPSEMGSSSDRKCLICKKEEVAIVFLPCAHQVLCANCNQYYGKKGIAKCPCYSIPIEERICIFGASS